MFTSKSKALLRLASRLCNYIMVAPLAAFINSTKEFRWEIPLALSLLIVEDADLKDLIKFFGSKTNIGF